MIQPIEQELARRMAADAPAGCPACGTRVVAPRPEVAQGPPFAPRLTEVATYLMTVQAQSEALDASGLATNNAQLAAQIAGDGGTRRWPTWSEVRDFLCGLAAATCPSA